MLFNVKRSHRKRKLFFFKETLKEIGTDCRKLREIIKRKREKDRKQKVRNFFLKFFLLFVLEENTKIKKMRFQRHYILYSAIFDSNFYPKLVFTTKISKNITRTETFHNYQLFPPSNLKETLSSMSKERSRVQKISPSHYWKYLQTES